MIVQRAAVICEFNPFHNGHKFLLEKIKEEFADEVVCIMSGNFVQRGDIAITDKYARARAALENGADMVAELPTVYAVSAAQVFAKSGVQIAYELGCEKLCFGSENSLEELYSLLDVLDAQETQKKIAGYMNDGDYYPLALSKAVGNDLSEIICKPNNILALEYIRACRSYGIEPIAIKRIGVGHDDTEVCGNIASATKIRELLINGEDCSPYTPMRISEPCQLSDIDQIICYLLRSKKPGDTEGIAGISEGLNHRLHKCAVENRSADEILAAAKTKRYTMARLRRAVISVCLNITDEMQHRDVPYIRVLGIRKDKARMIQSKNLPLIIDVRRGYDSLDQSAKEIFDIDIAAAELMNMCRDASGINEFSHGVIKV